MMTPKPSSLRSIASGVYYELLTRRETWRRRAYRRRHNPVGGLVERRFRGVQRIQVVKIGANDGVMADPLARLLRENVEWRCLFVEPVPWIFQRLKQNYTDDPRFTFEEAAVASEDGTMEFFSVKELPDSGQHLPEWTSGIGSCDRGHLERLLGEQRDEAIQRINVRTISFASLFERHEIETVDLLQIDTEGADYDLLCHFDFKRMRPSMLIVEHLHMSPEQRKAARALLKANGYSVRELEDDFIALLSKRT